MGKRFADEPIAKQSSMPAGFYVGKAEKIALLDDKTKFEVTAVEFQKGAGYKGSDRFMVTIVLDDTERGLSFQAGSVESRDTLLYGLASFLEQDDIEPTFAYLEKAGQATLFKIVGTES